MRERTKRALAAAMAVVIMGGVSQMPTVYAADGDPSASQIVPGEVKRNFTVPNSINVLVKDENGAQLKGGEFQLIAEDGTVVKTWQGGDGISSADQTCFANREMCQFRISDCYETGDYDGDIHFSDGSIIGRDGWIFLKYQDTVRYVSYGGKMAGEESVTIPAGEVWISVGDGYKREAGQEKMTQVVAYNNENYDLSDMAGNITKLQWPAGTSHKSSVYLRENGGTVTTSNNQPLTAASAAEEYRKITVDFHACYQRYVNEKGQYVWSDGTPYTFGAPIVKGDYVTSAYLQVTSGAVTNFVSLANGPTAEIYVKKGDYNPQVGFSCAGVHNGGGSSGTIFICGYMKHILSVTPPPEEGMTIGYIPAGTYTLHQKTAADGYMPAPDQQITVKDSNQATDLQKIEIVNKKELPHEHTFSKDWSKDENNHWHAATCEHSEVVADKAAHSYGEWNIVQEATEEQEGLQERSCTVCGFKQQEKLDKLPHEHMFSKDWSKDENNHWHAATCEHSEVVADKAAHTYGEWNIVQEATEEQEGLQERSCTVCGFKQQEKLDKLPHEHTFSKDWSKDENNHWHAATCEHSEVVADKVAHTYGEWKVVREATTEAEGLQERSCTVCGFTQQATIAKLPVQPTPPETPPTGDNSHLGLWAAVALAAGAGLVGTVLYRRKKRT